MDRYERFDSSERSEPYEFDEVQPRGGPRRVPRRVVRNWERLVRTALEAYSDGSSDCSDSDEELDEDEDAFDAMVRRRPSTKRLAHERSKSYAVPPSLAAQTDIDAVMETAEEIQKEDIEVARILFEYAYNLTHQMDPLNRGRGVLQFKSALRAVLMQRRIKHHIDRSQDVTLLTDYHTMLRERDMIEDLAAEEQAAREGLVAGETPEYQAWRAEKLRKFYETSNILKNAYNFLAAAQPEVGAKGRDPAKKALDADAKKIEQFKAYNILPLESTGVNNDFQSFPEVVAATRALHTSGWSEFPRFRDGYSKEVGRDVLDIFDFLHYAFGFQKDNVSNQREHLILLLANAESRVGTLAEGTSLPHSAKLSVEAIDKVCTRILANYVRWCEFLNKNSQTKLARDPQRQLCLTALYLLIWGEAANVRFLPECLCYIFHNMAGECFTLLGNGNVERSTVTIKVNGITAQTSKEDVDKKYEYAFLEQIVTPIYNVVAAESKNSEHGKAPHGSWRNYDDINEYFWQTSCFDLNWPWRLESGFFTKPKKKGDKKHNFARGERQPMVGGTGGDEQGRERRVGKINFVEHRSSFHLYHSFHRLWIFLACMLQVLAIWAFCSKNGKLNLHVRTIKRMMSVGVTFAVMKFFKSLLDVAFMWGAMRNTHKPIVTRTLIRLVWLACLSGGVTYLYVKTLQEDARNVASTPWFRLYYLVVGSYAGAQVLFSFILRLPFLRKLVDGFSKVRMCQFITWMQQERYYVGRGMYERTSDYVKYSLFWIVVLTCKFAFTMHFQILPMVEPTRLIIGFDNITYKWHSLVSKGNNNVFTLVSIWAPVVMIYVLDVQVWYTVLSALLGGLIGAKDKLGEIRSLDMLRKRFLDCPEAFVKHMDPSRSNATPVRRQSFGSTAEPTVKDQKAIKDKDDARRFLPIWNAVINSLRQEDLLNDRERSMLEMPENSDYYPNRVRDTVMCWPLFLIANKLHIAVNLAKENERNTQAELWEKVTADEYMKFAILESFLTLEQLLLTVLKHNDIATRWVNDIFGDAKGSAKISYTTSYNLKKLDVAINSIRDLTYELGQDEGENPACRMKAIAALNKLAKVVMNDLLIKESEQNLSKWAYYQQAIKQERLFDELVWPDEKWRIRSARLHNILKVHQFKDEVDGKQKTYNTESIPKNLEARRRLEFFTNSLFMHMPTAKPVSKMFSFCVFTPYYSEDVMYDIKKKNKTGKKNQEKSKKDEIKELDRENEDGITILFYLQKIYPDEYKNFLERLVLTEKEFERRVWGDQSTVNEDTILQLRLWASYRGQTLARTVRGMMYYKQALKLQAEQERTFVRDIERGGPLSSVRPQRSSVRDPQAQAELKFVYLVSCQIYGDQKKQGKPQAADILYLMKENESLRVAYVDEVTVDSGAPGKTYYSKLVKVDKSDKTKDQLIYSVKLPGPFKLGEGKPENQNHAIIFSRGDAVQTIDMNQDNYLEEAFKVRNLLEEFDQVHGRNYNQHPTILGVREHVFTGSVSSLAWFMSLQESSFVTLGQRVLARPLKVRMHYGHPDIFDRIFHMTTGGVSKASSGINLSEDIFAGFNTTLRQGNVTHHEYIQVGKGRDVGLNQIATFEAKVASGNGEQALARDLYRLGQLLDFPRMLSFFFTSVGFYVTTMMTVLTLYAFLYGKAYLALSGVDASLKANNDILGNSALQSVLASQFLFQIGIFTAIPMLVNLVLEKGLIKAIMDFCTMQLQLASVFFTFSLGTRTHYFGRIVLHGGAKYRSTGRGFVVRHINFAENYRLFSRSHFTKAFEIILLLVIYLAFGAQNRTSVTYILLTFSSWFLALSWLYAPYVFNPSGFEWQKTVEDFDDWSNWIMFKGGVGVESESSWEAWWLDEQAHLRTAAGKFWELLFSLRFFFFQYGVSYHLNVFEGSTSIMVYVYSWLTLSVFVAIFKVFTISQKASMKKAKLHLIIRLFQAALFMLLIAGAIVAIIVSPLSLTDCFAVALAILPTGWGLISIAIIFRKQVESIGLWHSVREIARLYDACMGMFIFVPIALLSWFPFFSTFQTRLVFNQAFSRGLEISLILAGNRANTST